MNLNLHKIRNFHASQESRAPVFSVNNCQLIHVVTSLINTNCKQHWGKWGGGGQGWKNILIN